MKKNLTKVMAMGMVMTILAGTTAFANETMLISSNPNADKTIESVIAEAEASMYLTQTGTVAGVEASETEGVKLHNKYVVFARISQTDIHVPLRYVTISACVEDNSVISVLDCDHSNSAICISYANTLDIHSAGRECG